MEGRSRLTLHPYLAGTNRIHKQAVVDRLGKQPQRQTRCTQQRTATHDAYVHLAVLHTGLGGDISLVAPLTGVGKGHQKGFVRHVNTIALQMVHLRTVQQHVLQHVLQVGSKPASGRARKLVCYQGIKTCATRADKQPTVSQSVVHADRLRVIQHFDGAVGAHRYIQMAGKTVAATHRQDTHRRLGAPQTTRYLVHRTVTAHGHHGIKTHARKLTGQILGVPLTLGEDNILQPLLVIQGVTNQLGQLAFVLRTRDRIDKKCNIFHCLRNIGRKITKKFAYIQKK